MIYVDIKLFCTPKKLSDISTKLINISAVSIHGVIKLTNFDIVSTSYTRLAQTIHVTYWFIEELIRWINGQNS